MDYAMLARNSIQSTSDQEDYRNYATISANAAIGVTPEQAAISVISAAGRHKRGSYFQYG